jgi:DNA-binding response OmpR family regulator
MSHLLILEPDRLLARIYQQALKHAGYEVSYVMSGQAAVDSADETRPDLVILELQLPAHNGLEFLYEFRSYVDWQQVPIIVNTTIPPDHIRPASESLYQELGVRAWHYKPETSLQLLIRSVNDELRRTKV